MCFLVVGISDVSDGNENFEWILFIGFTDASFNVALDFRFSFFTMSDLARLQKRSQNTFNGEISLETSAEILLTS